ncbi:MAG: NADH-quinone oxidoreductase subunit NuoE [Lentisphaerota bacterium]
MKFKIDEKKLETDIARWVKKHGSERSALITILHEVHNEYSWVPELAMQLIAEHLGMHPVEVYGVASFYLFFHVEPKGHKVIRVCQSICCDIQGKRAVGEALKERLGIDFGQTTYDGEYTLLYTNCMGQCDQGPAIMINMKPYTCVTPEKIDAILEEENSGAHK